MLEELRIQNFQRHRKLRVGFDPTITTIVGGSDVGKSAILRALRWVCTNQPKGDAHIRHGAKGCTVQLVVDGHTITRKRGGGKNTYELDGEPYKAFGTGVPDTIAGLLNMPDVCWQGQHDPSFWFGASPGEVSRQLNAIVDLGIIDTTLTNVGRTYTKARTALEVAEDNLTEAKASLDELDWVPACDSALLLAELLAVDASRATDKAENLRVLRHSALADRAQRDTAQRHADATQGLAMAAGAAVAAQDRADQLKALRLRALGAEMVANRPVPDFKPVHKATKAAVLARKQATKLAMLVQQIGTLTEDLCQAEKTLTEAQDNLPQTCPTCGQSLPATSTCNRPHR